MTADQVILTREGYEKLVDELNFLKTKKRREVANLLEHARALGDLSENAEYESAKHAKEQLEARIMMLEAKLGRARIVDNSEVRSDKAFLGASLEVKNLDTGDVFRYSLVSQDEADISQGKISVTSPIGKGFLGRGSGEKIEIQIPAGKVRYEILKITGAQ